MTTTTFDAAAIGSERSRPPLLAPLAGLAFVGGLIALFVTPAGEDTGETPREVVAYAASHEGWIIAMALFALAAIPLGAIFVATLLSRLRGLATATESTLVLIGGIVFTLCFALAFTIWSAPLTEISGDSRPCARPGRGLPRGRRHRLVPARGCRRRGGADGDPGLARGLAEHGRPVLALLGRGRAGRRLPRHDRLSRHVRLDGVDRRRVDRDARAVAASRVPTAAQRTRAP